MQILKIALRQIYIRADLNKNNVLTSQEIEDALKGGNINEEEAQLLREFYKIQYTNANKRYDDNPKMSLWELMQADNEYLDSHPDEEEELLIKSPATGGVDPEPNVQVNMSRFTQDEINWANRDFVLKAVKEDPDNLLKAEEFLRGDREIILAAVRKKGMLLEHASNFLKGDKEVVLAAVRSCGFALQFASDDLKRDREVVFAAVCSNGAAFQFELGSFKKDREFVIEAMKHDGWGLGSVDEQFRSDKEVVLAAVKTTGVALMFASDGFKMDSDVVTAAVKGRGGPICTPEGNFYALHYADSLLQEDSDIVLESVKVNGVSLRDASEDLRGNKEMVLAAMRENSEAFKYAAPSLLNDRNFIIEAMDIDQNIYQFIPDNLKNDKMFILTALRNYSAPYYNINERNKKDVDIYKAYLRLIFHFAEVINNGEVTLSSINKALKDGYIIDDEADILKKAYALQKANASGKYDNSSVMQLWEFMVAQNEQFKGGLFTYLEIGNSSGIDLPFDEEVSEIYSQEEMRLSRRDVSIREVSRDGLKLKDVDRYFQGDSTVVVAAVRNNGAAFQYADPSFRKDKDVIMQILDEVEDCDGSFFEYADESIKNDKKFVMAAIRKNLFIFQYCGEEMKKSKEVVILAVSRNAQALQYAYPPLRGDRDVVMAAVRHLGAALEHVEGPLRTDKEVVLTAVSNCGSSLQYADESMRKDKDVVLAAVNDDGMALEYADETMRKDREVVLAAVTNDGRAIKYIDFTLRGNRAIFEEAMKGFDLALQFADESLREQFPITNRVIKKLEALGITKMFRLGSLALANEVIKNRTSTEPDSRPVLVIVYPKSDWNGGFDYTPIPELLEKGTYRIMYYEAEKDYQLFKAVKEAGSKRKISVLMIGGHGTKDSIDLGEADPSKSKSENEESYIDLREKKELEILKPFLADGCIIALKSCSTGEGGKDGPNMANAIHEALPQTIVIAPTVPTSFQGFKFNSAGLVTGVNYSCGSNCTYVAK